MRQAPPLGLQGSFQASYALCGRSPAPLEHAIDGLYNPPLPQIELFPHADELVLHIVPDGRDQLEALLEPELLSS